MNALENLQQIASDIRELYPTEKVTVAIDLPMDDIRQLLIATDHPDIADSFKDVSFLTQAVVVFSIENVNFAVSEKKVDPNLN